MFKGDQKVMRSSAEMYGVVDSNHGTLIHKGYEIYG